MKKGTLLNAPLSAAIASMGHTDGLLICDAGYPIPREAALIDLALTAGVPSFLQVLDAACKELFVERILLAEEIETVNPALHQQILTYLKAVEVQQARDYAKPGHSITIEYTPHETFKQEGKRAKATVRSGECTPYANIILYAGVTF
ncbi:Ribose ABC transport system, high affinity permease RbsD (TC 3.A.1.2.1) [Cardiobacterium hominis]|uniref:D-ribose pyranase n=1 Tax=Cardiobacterium hominis TaxID=2718 RepID=A0A1C3H311_9GAMM|nr:D-ribose pyranase [Cardiobacterium hominis]SAM60059.1 Ribose ABC transport system, high affinity permease RbsD (TC 3.A.1.2.1) [Cardiobacterium hominis]